MKNLIDRFWAWYDRHYTFNLTVTTLLFLLQLVHLYWMGTHVLSLKIFGYSLFNPGELYSKLIILADYLEIPALLSSSILYLRELARQANTKSLLLLLFINLQWVHLFWITDEFILSEFRGETSLLPEWLAFIAILIDYLEVPAIMDTSKKLYHRIVYEL